MKQHYFISLTIVLFLLFCSFSMHGQKDKQHEFPKYIFGVGDVSAGFSINDKLVGSINPYLGFNINKNFAFGLDYGITKDCCVNKEFNLSVGLSENALETSYRHNKLGLFGRYTYKPESLFSIYLQGGINSNFEKIQRSIYETIDPPQVDSALLQPQQHRSFSTNFNIGLQLGRSDSFKFIMDFRLLNYNASKNTLGLDRYNFEITPKIELRF